jgi:transcriptional regulator GlxA family with amidase domain
VTTARLGALIARLLSSPLCKGVLPGMYIEARALDLLRLSLTEIVGQREQIARSRLRDDDIRKIRDVYRYYQENFIRPEAFSVVARRAGMNIRKLEAGFKELFHTTLVRFLADLRLDHARKLIGETDLPIKAIMTEAGYHTVPAFSRAFKARFGTSPSAFPRAMRRSSSEMPISDRL